MLVAGASSGSAVRKDAWRTLLRHAPLVYTYHQRTPTSGQMRNEGIEVILFVRDRLGSYKIEQTTRIT